MLVVTWGKYPTEKDWKSWTQIFKQQQLIEQVWSWGRGIVIRLKCKENPATVGVTVSRRFECGVHWGNSVYICMYTRVRVSIHGCAPVTRLGPRGKVCRDEQDLATQGNGQKHSLGRASRGTRCEQHSVAKTPFRVPGAQVSGETATCWTGELIAWQTVKGLVCEAVGPGAWSWVTGSHPSEKAHQMEWKAGAKKKKKKGNRSWCHSSSPASHQFSTDKQD